MKCECPKCGKTTDVSAEELAWRGGAVVCPQCLSVYRPDGADHDHNPADTVPLSRRAPETIPEHHAYAYCPTCGKSIPKGVNFCPYCGVRLSDAGYQPAAVPVAPVAPAFQAPTQPVDGHADNNDPTPANTSAADDEQRWKPFLPSLQFGAARGQERHRHELPSRRFRAFAYSAIAVLLTLLAVIIYKAVHLIRAIDHFG